tara:strand:+ start:138 stop:473 length:336 start_codon:yes stop_codon:yes gene_type:complete
LISIDQIGGFCTATTQQRKKEETMALPFAAGSVGMRFLRTLYKGKKKIGKGASMAAGYAGKKGFVKTSQAITGASKKVHRGTMSAKSLAKKYPKSTAAIGGAAAWDMLDRD